MIQQGNCGPITVEICEVRSFLTPRPWQVFAVWRWLRLKYRMKYDRKKLSEETQQALEWLEEALEREYLYG